MALWPRPGPPSPGAGLVRLVEPIPLQHFQISLRPGPITTLQPHVRPEPPVHHELSSSAPRPDRALPSGQPEYPLTSVRPGLFEYCRHTGPRSPLLLSPQARPSPPHGPSSVPAQEDRDGAHLPSLASCAGLSSVMTCGRNGRRCRRPSASFMPAPLQRTSAAAAHLPRPLHTPLRNRPLAPPPRTPDHARALPSGRRRSPPQRAGGEGPAVSSGVAGRAVRIDSYTTATGISASSTAASWAVWGSRGQGWVLQLFPSRARPWHGEPEHQGPQDGARKPQGSEGGREGRGDFSSCGRELVSSGTGGQRAARGSVTLKASPRWGCERAELPVPHDILCAHEITTQMRRVVPAPPVFVSPQAPATQYLLVFWVTRRGEIFLAFLPSLGAAALHEGQRMPAPRADPRLC